MHAPHPREGGYSNELVAEYASALTELTFNSKPLINNLTIIAGENMHAAENIVECIERRLYQAPPGQKLPCLYLLDSIVKNIGGAYHGLFQRNIVSTFRTVYDVVDEPTRASMQRLLATWTSVWPRKAQLIQERLPGIGVPPGSTRAGIHINPAYLAKLQANTGAPAQAPGRPNQSYAAQRRGGPSPAVPPSGPRPSRSPPRRGPKRGRSPQPARYGPSGTGGGPHKAARRSPPDRVAEILSGSQHGYPADRYQREPTGGGGGFRDVPQDRYGARGPGHLEDARRPPDHPGVYPSGGPTPHHPPSHSLPPHMTAGPLPSFAQNPPPVYGQPPLTGPVPTIPHGQPPAAGGHQAILAEAHTLMQQLEQRLQTQLNQPDADRNDVMRQLGQLRTLQQQANQIMGQAQPGQAAPMPAPSLAQNLQGIGQGQQARESILSLLQGALATALNPKPMQPASAAPASQLFPPTSLPGGYPSAQASGPLFGLSPPSSASSAPTTSTTAPNLMNFGMFSQTGFAPSMDQSSSLPTAPPATVPSMLPTSTQPMPGVVAPPVTMPNLPTQPLSGMPAVGTTYPQPSHPSMPGYPSMPPSGVSSAPYRPVPGNFEPQTKRRRLDLVTDREQVNKLYADFELQCGTCGLRFNDKDKLANHLDWHFAVNKKEKQKTKKAISRMWYPTSEEWAEGVEATDKPAAPFFGGENTTEEAAEAPVTNVVADETQTQCGICNEKFDQFWDNDLEEWMYRGTVKVEGTDQIFHQKCYEQALAMSQAQQQETSSSSSSSSASSDSAMPSTSSVTDPSLPSSVDAGAHGAAPSSSPFWVKKEPEGEVEGERGPSPDNRDTTTPAAEGSRASVVS